jgi:hypothetical protein
MKISMTNYTGSQIDQYSNNTSYFDFPESKHLKSTTANELSSCSYSTDKMMEKSYEALKIKKIEKGLKDCVGKILHVSVFT